MSYLAPAHYELGQYDQAEQTLRRIQERFPYLWTDADRERRALCGRARKTSEGLALGDETPAHAVYCESDWLLDKRGGRVNPFQASLSFALEASMSECCQ